MELNQILLGACEDLLKTFPDNFFDSIVTDPPYGLGTREPTAEDIRAYLEGGSLDTGGDFMGKEWEIPSVAVWRECYRVLKPGGYILSFGSTRTWDIMSVGIRAAGFTNRDTISSAFRSPALMWMHGQGFPKSLNIWKTLKKEGKICVCDEPTAEVKAGHFWPVCTTCEKPRIPQGLGTALKPAWEPILCYRKPVAEETTSEQVLTTGTGGIDIDGTSIKHSSAADFEKHKQQVERIKEKGGSWDGSWKNSSDLSGASDVTSAGRWPPNVTLTHSEECTPDGCAEGCAVSALDEQTGVLKSGRLDRASITAENKVYGKAPKERVGIYEPTEGGASRFFAQFMPDAPFFYTGKATKKEKNEGIVEVRFRDGFVQLKKDLKDEQMAEVESDWPETNIHYSLQLMEEAVPSHLRQYFEPVKPEDNNHPTVKPVALMEWLVRMVTPKGGRTLDPYCGSGTTCAAAINHGVEFLGIDRDPMFHQLATRRVSVLLSKSRIARQERDIFDEMMALDDV